MNLMNWSYTKKHHIKAKFDIFPNSVVTFREIKKYYFVYTIKWSTIDPAVTKKDLETMEWLINIELGTADHYQKRKKFKRN